MRVLKSINLLLVPGKGLSGGFSLGWPVAGMGSVTDPDQFGIF